jgi:uncharacterized membrane protein YcaP (DUF421 family)
MEALWESFSWALGLELENRDLKVWQMALRAAIVFSATLLMIRVGQRRFMGKNTAFDVTLGIIFGSVVSRAITGNAPFLPALCAGAVLVFLHWAFSALAFHSHNFGLMIKGEPRTLVENGEIDWNAMRKDHVTRMDLEEELRLHGKTNDLQTVETAQMERNGQISVVTRKGN